MKRIVNLIIEKYGKDNVIEIISDEHASKALNQKSGEKILITLPYLNADMTEDNHAIVYSHVVQILQPFDRNNESTLIEEMYKMQDKATSLLEEIKEFVAESYAISRDDVVEITPVYNIYTTWCGYVFSIAYQI